MQPMQACRRRSWLIGRALQQHQLQQRQATTELRVRAGWPAAYYTALTCCCSEASDAAAACSCTRHHKHTEDASVVDAARSLLLLLLLSPCLPACSSSQWPPQEGRYTPFFQLWADGNAGRRLWGWLASASYCGLTLFLTKCRCMRRKRKKNRNRDECRGWSLREEEGGRMKVYKLRISIIFQAIMILGKAAMNSFAVVAVSTFSVILWLVII